MRYCIFILLFIPGYAFNGFSQREIESKRIVIHNGFIKLFQRHSTIREIAFSVNSPTDSVRLEIIEQSDNEEKHSEVYDFKQKGDRFIFEKKYGKFIFPSFLVKDFIDSRASFTEIKGLVRYDSVFMSINQWFETKTEQTDEDKIFEKVEITARYEKGDLVLAKEMENYFHERKLKDVPADSVVILFAIINPNKTIVVNKVIEGNSKFANSLTDFINTSGPWVPTEACGRKVRAYKKIYARLNNDNSFDVSVY